MKRCVIFGASPDPESFEYDAAGRQGDYLIAADGGYRYCRQQGLVPDHLVGDFDSFTGQLPAAVEAERFNPHKDDTDLTCAAKHGFGLGYREFYFTGVLGGRLDHTLGNLQLGAWLCRRGCRCEFGARRQRVYFLTRGSILLPRRPGWNFSLVSWSDRCTGVFIRGGEYPLEDRILTNSYALGISNEFAADTAEISVRDGVLLVMTAYCPKE